MTRLKKTKIVATISDKNSSVEFIRNLFEEGMNVVRLNSAHQTTEQALKVIQEVREVSEKIAILIDTKGPEVRTDYSDQSVDLKCGDQVKIIGKPGGGLSQEAIYVSYKDFVNDVPDKSCILIDDGYIELQVIKKTDEYLLCEAKNDGTIKGRKSVNVPNVSFNLPSLSKKDKDFIQLAIEQDIDFIAHSFVRRKQDIIDIQEILDEKESEVKIIAKIENQEGLDNIDEILDYAYGIMVARGDLAIEVPYERIPGVQRWLINKCIERRKPVIIATQMLHSMIHSPRPTRAEVNDVASAIYNNADAIMLSGETAYGDYPVAAVRTMNKIAFEVEHSKDPINDIPIVVINNPVSAFLCKSSVDASIKLDAKAILADTASGRTIRSIAAYRGAKPIFAQCYSKRTMRELALSYGAYPAYMQPHDTSHEFLSKSLNRLIEKQHLNIEDMIVVVAGNFGRSVGASFIEIGSIQHLIGQKNI